MAFNWRDIFSGGSLTSFSPGNVPVSAGGSGMHPGMESGYQPVYGELNQPPVLGVPQLGYKPVSNISTSTGAPDKRSWFDRLDKQALEDVAGLATPQRQQGRTLGAPGIGFARAQGGNVPLSKGYEHTYAPNPGLALFVPQKEKNRFAGMS